MTIGLAIARRFEWKDAPAYIGTQVVAGLAAGGVLVVVASGKGFIHLISIPVTNTSVNPARLTGVAFFNVNGAPELHTNAMRPHCAHGT